MNLAKSLQKNEKMENVLKIIRNIGWTAPAWMFPSMAMAANAVPKGFEDFSYVAPSDSGLFQFIIEFNKSFIILIQQTLSNNGMEAGSAGLAIVLWASFLKIATTPLYYNALKYPL